MTAVDHQKTRPKLRQITARVKSSFRKHEGRRLVHLRRCGGSATAGEALQFPFLVSKFLQIIVLSFSYENKLNLMKQFRLVIVLNSRVKNVKIKNNKKGSNLLGH